MKMLTIIIMAFVTLSSCNMANDKSEKESKIDNNQAQQTEQSQEINKNDDENFINEPNNSVISDETSDVNGTIKLNKQMFLEKVWDYESNPETWVYKGDKPALIDFYADWCRPCKIAAPILEELAIEFSGDIYIYKIDTEVEKELATVFGITGIPAFLYIPQTEQPVMMSGIAQTNEETKKMFKDNINQYLLK
jgi:thioredoxin 1